MSTFADLRSANLARQKEWDPGSAITLAYRGNELAGEVGEACNIIKKIERERLGLPGSRATKDQLAEELADVVICADLIAMDAGIDLLRRAVPAKFNATSRKVDLATRLSPAAEYTAQQISALLQEAFNAGWAARDSGLLGHQSLRDAEFRNWRQSLGSEIDWTEVEPGL
jgi:NTP pyrophosphatase (non-canonical NTP hydrolase)